MELKKKITFGIIALFLFIFVLSMVIKTSRTEKAVADYAVSAITYAIENSDFEKKESTRTLKGGAIVDRTTFYFAEDYQRDCFVNAVSAMVFPATGKFAVTISSDEAIFFLTISDSKHALYNLNVSFQPLIHKNRIAIVIDDLGYDEELLDPFIKSGMKFTYAVMPGERHTKKCVQRLRKEGLPYILHLPMEPYGHTRVKAGKYALLRNMSQEEISRMIDNALEMVPGVKGINNHMGSAFTEDFTAMKFALKHMKSKKLFFLDSRTSEKTAGYKASLAAGIKFRENNLFLDNSRDYGYVKKQFEALLRHARTRKKSVAIGHIGTNNIPLVMAELKPRFDSEDMEFVYLEEIIK